jgi:hypothetical protein
MSKSDPVATNPNNQMPAGEGLAPDQIVPEEFEDEKLYARDRKPNAEDKDQIEDRENQASTEQVDGDKFQRD